MPVIQERLSPCKYPYENMYWEMSNLLGILSKQKLYSNSFSSDNVTYTQNKFSKKSLVLITSELTICMLLNNFSKMNLIKRDIGRLVKRQEVRKQTAHNIISSPSYKVDLWDCSSCSLLLFHDRRTHAQMLLLETWTFQL